MEKSLLKNITMALFQTPDRWNPAYKCHVYETPQSSNIDQIIQSKKIAFFFFSTGLGYNFLIFCGGNH